jgi:hypothetical protein
VSPIEQLQIIRYPNDVVIDKLNAVGEWEEEIESDGSPHFKGQAKKAEARVPAGLYLLNIVLKDGTRTDGWFALDDDMNASTSPKLYQPTAHQELQSNHPVIKFEEYRSPEYKPYEKRSVIAHVETPEWQTLWWGGFNYPDDEIATSLTLGSENSDHQTYDFADGKYWLGFGFRESHRFGDLKIMRVSKISRPFKVKGGK